jgi:hypothetical protein
MVTPGLGGVVGKGPIRGTSPAPYLSRRSGSDVRAEASRDPRDKAKAGLPEAQSPDDERERPPERHLMLAPCPATASRVRPPQPSGRWALPSEGNQGDEWNA